MADKKSFNFSPVPEEIPSPDELFHGKRNRAKDTQGESVSVRRRKPIPRYKIVKRFTGGFLIFLIALVFVMMNLDRAGIHFYYMMSSSMKSVIPKGSLLVGHETKADKLKTGDIITYTDMDGMSVTHEIVEVVPSYSHGEPGYWTKGTDNRDRDEHIVKYADVRGKVIFHIPYIGYFFMKVKDLAASYEAFGLRSASVVAEQTSTGRLATLAAVAKCTCKHAHLARCSRE